MPAPRYPADWPAFSRRIRVDRAQGQCECRGECGLHRTTGGPRRCIERDGTFAIWAKGRVRLTVAHLNGPGGQCRCDPLCVDEAHVLAMCQRCHLRYDVPLHRRNASATRYRKRNNRDLFEEAI